MDKKRIIFFSSLAVGSLCLVFLMLSVFVGNNKTVALAPLQYVLDANPMLPSELGYSDEYIYSQIPLEGWPQEQVDEWFIRPEGQNLNQLKAANDQVIRRILEVAP